jgi:hypothetical protein
VSDQPDAVDMHNLTFTDEPVLDAPTPAHPDDVKVARSYRLPVELDRWISQTARAKGVKPAAIVRELLELGRVAYEQADRRVSMADVLAALASVRSGDAA